MGLRATVKCLIESTRTLSFVYSLLPLRVNRRQSVHLPEIHLVCADHDGITRHRLIARRTMQWTPKASALRLAHNRFFGWVLPRADNIDHSIPLMSIATVQSASNGFHPTRLSCMYPCKGVTPGSKIGAVKVQRSNRSHSYGCIKAYVDDQVLPISYCQRR